MVKFSPQKKKTTLNTDDIDLLCRQGLDAFAREDFMEFRKRMRPSLLKAWWQEDVAEHLNQFWRDLLDGRRPALVLQAPPQHGKTEQLIDFVAWCVGRNPNLKVIFGSYSDDLGVRVNLSLQRLFELPAYKQIFANTRIAATMGSTVEDAVRWLRNTSLLEFVGADGSFRNTTVGGPINGMGLDLGIIDDPIKGRAEASSKTIRDKTWNWFTDDFFGRFSNYAGFVMIMTRWHLDDPVGRWLDYFPHTKILRYPAIAERDEPHRKKGTPLFPELKSIEFLDARRRVLTNAGWESVWQQRPIAAGGDMFPVDRFKIIGSVDRSNVRRSIRYVDKAGTDDGGAYTAAALVHDMKDGTTVVEDVLRGQWGALERETRLRQAAQTDKAVCPRYEIWVEQEPGSGGKESAESTIRSLKGFRAFADKVTGDKVVRAEPYAAQVQNGSVSLVAAAWNRPFLEEHEVYPLGKYLDQVDATAGAVNKLAAAMGSYDRTMSWVG